ncbi:MAG: protein-L-isoaspartate(D-aspartate) O-methyltransferase [Acetobacteraceae bacterium]|nr:protein-L-isoaspartate(D-aspartate) O-methyltransferase [Acetobacteraceae bacterium]
MDPQQEMLAQIEAEACATARRTGRTTFSPRVMAALRAVRRDRFVPPGEAAYAYADAPLPIAHGQTISQPFIVALMTDLLELKPGAHVLEVGTGSGYQAAVLAELTPHVCSIEVIPALADEAARTLADNGYADRVALRTGDGALGWPERAPFDGIIVTAAAPDVPPALIGQLRPGGRLVIPVGPPWGSQSLRVLHKHADGTVSSRTVLGVMFVPLTGGINA